MLKIQMVSFILCLLGAFKDNFVVEVSVQNKKNLHQRGLIIKILCELSLAPRSERLVWAKREHPRIEVRRPLRANALLRACLKHEMAKCHYGWPSG